MQTIAIESASSNVPHRITMPDESFVDSGSSLRMAARLQVTLDLERLIGLFVEEANLLLDDVALHYAHPGLGIKVGIAPQGVHRCSYDLRIVDMALGEVTIARAKRFQKWELEVFEALLGGLLFPLRNALQYRDALEAAHRDPLTGLYNRAALDEALGNEISRAHRNGNPLALLMIDIDHFKDVNDRYGHLAGDRVLGAVAQCLSHGKRDADRLYRYGGEEFALLLPETALAEAGIVAERMRALVAGLAIDCDAHPVDARTSIGVACLRSRGDANQLLHSADLALYRAKRLGRDRVCLELSADISQPALA